MENPAEIDKNEVFELIAFRIAEQDFCFDIMAVREIRGWTPATVIPHAPNYVLGVINLRGAVVPVVDLAHRLKLNVPEPNSRNVVIITQFNGRMVGLLVDAVSDILSEKSGDIQPTPDVANEDATGIVTGIITHQERMIRILDLEAIVPPKPSEFK